jgi:transcriptional regulator of nitric oxide reductase
VRFCKRKARQPQCCRANQIQTLILLEAIMANLTDVNAALDALDQSVQDLAARVQPQDLQPVVDRVNNVKAEVDAVQPSV